MLVNFIVNVSVFHGRILKADENTAGDTNNENQTENDEGGDNYQNHQSIVLLWLTIFYHIKKN